MSDTELVKYTPVPGWPSEHELAVARTVATIVHQSGTSKLIEPTIAAVILAGRELGLSPFIALRALWINPQSGRIEATAEYVHARMREAGCKVKVVTRTEIECRLIITPPDDDAVEVVYTIQDARRAGLIRPGSQWEKGPRSMLFARAISEGRRVAMPQVLLGVYTMGETGEEVPEEPKALPAAPAAPTAAQVLRGAAAPAPPPPPVVPEAPPAQVDSPLPARAEASPSAPAEAAVAPKRGAPTLDEIRTLVAIYFEKLGVLVPALEKWLGDSQTPPTRPIPIKGWNRACVTQIRELAKAIQDKPVLLGLTFPGEPPPPPPPHSEPVQDELPMEDTMTEEEKRIFGEAGEV